MTLTKANIAQKIADDCGFMKGEASEIIEKLLEIMKKKTHRRRRRHDFRLWKMACQI